VHTERLGLEFGALLGWMECIKQLCSLVYSFEAMISSFFVVYLRVRYIR
jgi:hypothetical protein